LQFGETARPLPFPSPSSHGDLGRFPLFCHMRPTMRFVPIKSTEQQDLQLIHRARDRIVCVERPLSTICGDSLASTALFCRKARGGCWRKPARPSRTPNCQILHVRSSATCLMSSSASISGLISLIDSSWPFAGRTKPAGALEAARRRAGGRNSARRRG
jgi:hypothetical protein